MDIAGTVGRYMAAIILMAAVLAFIIPGTGLWLQTKWINYLLMIIMFGMGLTIRPADFKVVFTRPRDVLIGCLAQFTIMPVVAYVLCITIGRRQSLWPV